MKYTEQEQLSVSNQVDQIIASTYERFHTLMAEDRIDDAIALADELYEWLADIDSETLLFYNEKELFSVGD